jgi:hypothetical protein
VAGERGLTGGRQLGPRSRIRASAAAVPLVGRRRLTVADAATETAGYAHPPHAAERLVRRAIERRREAWPLGK